MNRGFTFHAQVAEGLLKEVHQVGGTQRQAASQGSLAPASARLVKPDDDVIRVFGLFQSGELEPAVREREKGRRQAIYPP